MATVYLDPVTRIEGHLSVELEVENRKVVDAHVKGEMFRGFEMLLKGRNPVDANQITQRICGVCPVSHSIASGKSLERAFNIVPNRNGRLVRDLVLAANYIQSHILHFYHLCVLDYVDIKSILEYRGSDRGLLHVRDWGLEEFRLNKNKPEILTAAAPFLPRYEGDNFYIKDKDINFAAVSHYLQAFEIRMKAHRMVAIFGGRAPHLIGIVPGGVTQVPQKSHIRDFKKILREVETFVNQTYLNDVLSVAQIYNEYFNIGKFSNMLSYGVFEEKLESEDYMMKRGTFIAGKKESLNTENIREQVGYSRYSSGSNLHPFNGDTEPAPRKKNAYSWIKAPRYKEQAFEVGPLARIVVSYYSEKNCVKSEVDTFLKKVNMDISALFSVLGRHAARAIEAKILCSQMYKWLDELEPGESPRNSYEIPESGRGEGLIEAPRGALGHWISIKNHKIQNYQALVPTTWFCSPRDDRGVRGPLEQALIGTEISDDKNPIEAARVVRSFDPCIACAIHIVDGERLNSVIRKKRS